MFSYLHCVILLVPVPVFLHAQMLRLACVVPKLQLVCITPGSNSHGESTLMYNNKGQKHLISDIELTIISLCVSLLNYDLDFSRGIGCFTNV